MHTCRSRFSLEIIFVFSCILWTLPGAKLKCAGLDSPFDILPEGDHIIEYGSDLELFCKLDKDHADAQGQDARDLGFYVVQNKEWITLPNVTVLNDTTIKVDLVGSLLNETYYLCALNSSTSSGSIVCLTSVLVGYKPQPVLDFQCTSQNWERLYCNWTPPENPIQTEYKLSFWLNGRSGRPLRKCPNQLDVRNNTCVWEHESDPPFRQPHEYYNFVLFGKNVLGSISLKYTFNHFAHVIPNKPENLTIVNKTVGSAVVGWRVPYPVFNFPPGLRLKIEYKNKWEDWKEADVPQDLRVYGINHTYNITGLKYSHTPYDVRLYLKSFKAKLGSYGWSQPASITFVTPSTVPSSPPLTTHGCFDAVSSGNDTEVFIYWARVPERFENGDDFNYNVICSRSDGSDCGPPTEKSASYAKFPIDSLHSYNFTIYSVNEVGRSVNTSYVFVPKYGSFIQPESFTKAAYENGVFELSWKPVFHKNLSNYTIFWCKEERDLPVPCRGYLDWVTVPKNATSKNISMSEPTKFFKFAIAANLFDGTSSGMTWSSCVILHNQVLKKVDDFYITRFGSREVDVEWKIRCAQSSVFKGFAFYYCPVDFSSQENQCKGNVTEEVMKVNGSQERNVTLTNLKPYTTYKLQISIIALDGSNQIQLGPKSIPKRFSTVEDAPSEPVNLSAASVTSNSITLMWGLPKEINGVLQTYKLRFESPGSEKEIEFNAKNSSDSSIISKYRIQNLKSFTTYNFSLKACTSSVKCSDFSNPAVVTTCIGAPGKMMKPQVSIVNTSVADVSWHFPSPSAGLLDYYQLLVTVDGGSADNEIFNLTGSRVKLAIKACQVKHNTPEFRIRAININENNVNYYGPWSEATKEYCSSSVWAENAVLIDWLSGSCGMLIGFVCLMYVFKKGWLHCRNMKNVEIKLPSGLQSQNLEKEKKDSVPLERRPPRSPETVTGSVGPVLAPDEESLLDKKSDESMDITSFNMPQKNGGDSSGCSVGRESVSSSIISDTHVSSDSGAEPDQCMIKPTAFESWNSSGRRNGTNPKLRNGSPKEALNFPGLGDWDINEPTIPGYTKVGFTNCFVPDKNLPGKGYVTIARVTSANPAPKTTGASTGNGISGSSCPSSAEDPFSSDDPDSNNGNFENPRPETAAPRYMSLAHFEGQRRGEPCIPTNMQNGGRSPERELPKLSRLDESSERDDEKTADSTDEDFSGKETDTETIHEVPVVARNLVAMPPYVSMTDNPGASLHVNNDDDDDDEDDEEEEECDGDNDKENFRLSNGTDKSADKPTANGIDTALVDKGNKQSELFSNYIPQHLCGKESSVHT